MKAEVKTVAFMFFSVVMQFVYSLGGGGEYSLGKNKNKKKKKTEFGGGGEWRGARAEEQEGQILVAELQGTSVIEINNRRGANITK